MFYRVSWSDVAHYALRLIRDYDIFSHNSRIRVRDIEIQLYTIAFTLRLIRATIFSRNKAHIRR